MKFLIGFLWFCYLLTVGNLIKNVHEISVAGFVYVSIGIAVCLTLVTKWLIKKID
ncbi:MAG: hypothetical protein Q7R94_03250 [bacterium]|nr:hypothetical protein [bacterium]